MGYERRTKHSQEPTTQQIFIDFVKTRRNSLKQFSLTVQVAIRFHPGYPPLKSHINSFNALVTADKTAPLF